MIEKIKRLFTQPLSLGDITSDTNKQMVTKAAWALRNTPLPGYEDDRVNLSLYR